MKLHKYQKRTQAAVRELWNHGAQSVCLVAPTGARKTLLGQSLIDATERVLWVAHRRELVLQAAIRLRAAFGDEQVGIVMPGASENPAARIHVGTVQTLLGRDRGSAPDLIILDECHHFLSATWLDLATAYPSARTLSLTATPERDDGTPLGDIFQHMVVSASYSELLTLGHLVPSRVYQPEADLGSDIALDPVDAWLKYSEGDRTFAFEPRITLAAELAMRFRARGVHADHISADTPTVIRDGRLASLRAGALRVLTNVYALTEGVDVPELRVILIARPFDFVGGYIQTVGRALRSAEGKQDAIIIDLCGASLRHGLPGQDRVYSLTGKPISTAAPRERFEFERAAFSRTVVGAALRLASPGVLEPGAQPIPVHTVADPRAEHVRRIGDRWATRSRGSRSECDDQRSLGSSGSRDMWEWEPRRTTFQCLLGSSTKTETRAKRNS